MAFLSALPTYLIITYMYLLSNTTLSHEIHVSLTR